MFTSSRGKIGISYSSELRSSIRSGRKLHSCWTFLFSPLGKQTTTLRLISNVCLCECHNHPIFVSSSYAKPSSDPVQQVFENLRKTRTNVTISKVKCSKPVPNRAAVDEEKITILNERLETENSKVDTCIESQCSDVETVNDETNQIIEYYEEYLNDFDQPTEDLEAIEEAIEKECESQSPSPTKSTTATLSSLIVQPVNATTKSSTKPTVVKMLCEASFVCMTCKINVHTFEELRIHMKTNAACKKINLTCETCGKVCDSKKSLYQHTLTHKQKSSFVCDECGKLYTNRFNLENHRSYVVIANALSVTGVE